MENNDLNLHELQQHFFDAIFSRKVSEHFLMQIEDYDHRDAKRALEIYRASVMGNYIECLKRTYPVCLALVGEEFFTALATYYIEETPSYSENLNNYGKGFSPFIKQFPHTQAMPYLADVAQLEWLCHEVINAEASPELEGEHWQSLLADDDLEQVRFCLPKALALMQSDYPIQKIWHSNQPHFTGDDTIDLQQGGDNLIILRHGETIEVIKVPMPEWLLLQLIQQKKTFGEIYIAFSEKNFNVVSLIPFAVKQHWIIGFTKQGY